MHGRIAAAIAPLVVCVLGVSASALSHALRNIEERLDVRLINRTTRSVALTEAGARKLEAALPAWDEAQAEVSKKLGTGFRAELRRLERAL